MNQILCNDCDANRTLSEVIRTAHGVSDTRSNSDNQTTYSLGQPDKYFDLLSRSHTLTDAQIRVAQEAIQYAYTTCTFG